MEANIQAAISAFQDNEQKSIYAATVVFSILDSILRARIAGRSLRSHAHEAAQILSNAKEKTLVR
jgi:uncharacterized protein (UPF0147 family)